MSAQSSQSGNCVKMVNAHLQFIDFNNTNKASVIEKDRKR